MVLIINALQEGVNEVNAALDELKEPEDQKRLRGLDGQLFWMFQGLRGREQQREETRGVPGAEHFHKLMIAIVGSLSGRAN